MNWYKIFYWLTVADNARGFFWFFAVVTSLIAIISMICFFVYAANDEEKYQRWSRNWMWWSWPIMIIFWLGVILTPSKLRELQPGQSFIVETQAKTVTHYATVAGVKVTTAQCLLIEDLSGEPKTTRVVKVTIVGTVQPDKKKHGKARVEEVEKRQSEIKRRELEQLEKLISRYGLWYCA